MKVFPKDSKTRDGKLFWFGNKTLPEPITFDPSDPLHVKFIMATANLIAYNFNIKQELVDVEMIASMAAKVQV